MIMDYLLLTSLMWEKNTDQAVHCYFHVGKEYFRTTTAHSNRSRSPQPGTGTELATGPKPPQPAVCTCPRRNQHLVLSSIGNHHLTLSCTAVKVLRTHARSRPCKLWKDNDMSVTTGCAGLFRLARFSIIPCSGFRFRSEQNLAATNFSPKNRSCSTHSSINLPHGGFLC